MLTIAIISIILSLLHQIGSYTESTDNGGIGYTAIAIIAWWNLYLFLSITLIILGIINLMFLITKDTD